MFIVSFTGILGWYEVAGAPSDST